MTNIRKNIATQFIIIALSALIFIPFIGRVHLFDWDEINFAESAREMIVSDNYLTVQIDYKPFWEKPPLFIWMQVVSMKIFGINEFAARFPNAICGIITMLVLFNIGKKLFSHRLGNLWCLVYTGSILPLVYFKSGIMDPWFNLFIFLGIYFIFRYVSEDKNKTLNTILSSFFIGLSILTKGPTGLLIFILTAGLFFLLKKFKIKIRFKDIVWFLFILIFTGGFWFILQLINGNGKIIQDFIHYQVYLFQTKAGNHGGFLLYHFLIILIGVFPASVLAIKGFKMNFRNQEQNEIFRQFMFLLFWVVIIIFTIVKTKIIHYSSLCYFPVTFLAAYMTDQIMAKKSPISIWQIMLLSFLAIFFTAAAFVLPSLNYLIEYFIHNKLITDLFTIGMLQANVRWTGFEFLPGIILLLTLGAFVYLYFKQFIKSSLVVLFSGTIFFTSSFIYLVIPKIEQISQHALIEFLEEKKSEDCYIYPYAMKSYAHLFYFQKKPDENNSIIGEKCLLEGNPGKNVYFFMRNKDAEKFFNSYPQMIKLYEKNGYVFAFKGIEKMK